MAVLCSRCGACTYEAKRQSKTCAQSVSKGSPCSPCKERAAIRRQIKDLEEQIAKLKAEHDTTLAAAMNEAHDPFIHKFPPEIVSRIFHLSLPTLNDGDRDEKDVQGLSSLRTVWAAPLKLGSVCRRWRELAWATPSLWTTVYLAIKPTMRHSTAIVLPTLLGEWLGRSGALPLTVHFFYGTDDSDSDSEDEDEDESDDDTSSDSEMPIPLAIATDFVIHILNRHASRWRSLRIKARGEIFEYFSVSEEPKQLVTLELNVIGEYLLPRPRFLKSMLNPTRLKLVEYPLRYIDFRWDNVTHATFREITIDQGLDFLRGAPNLEYYRVIMFNPFENVHISNTDPILHLRLRSLHLATDCFENVLEIISVPSLQEWTQDVVGEPLPAMLSLVERSRCCLKTLNLHGVSPPTEDILTLLQGLPSLERIRLYCLSLFCGDHVTNDILKRIFSSAPDTRSNNSVEILTSEDFLPRLQFIECRTDRERSPLSWDSIPALYRQGHRRSITLKAIAYGSDISDQTALQLLQLRDEGVDLQIMDSKGRDFLEKFRKRKRKYKASH